MGSISHRARSIKLTTALAAAVLLASMLAFGASLYLVLLNGKRQDDHIAAATRSGRIELCRSIDADHNRQRAEIVTNTGLIYTVKEFHVLIPTPASERVAYENARKRYYSIRKSRPSFCAALVSNSVPPFPPLQHFQALQQH